MDSEDLSLNISRETLQKDNQLKLMRNSLEKKIKNELHAMLVNDREKYETFWKNFGRQIKFGIYGDYGMHKDLLGDLLMFYSAKEKKLVTLDEYVEKMPEDQKCIYFAAGDDTDRLGKLPNAQLVLSKGYDLLLCTEDVDEFCLQMMRDYKEKEFKNINSGDLGLETEDEKKAAEAAETENKDLFEEIKKDLNGKVKEVKVNPTLQEHPVTLSAEGGISMEMEKVLRRMPNAEGVESTKVLELNPNHTVFAALKAAHAAGDTDKVAKYAELLYDQALLIAGLPIEDPVAYAQLVCGKAYWAHRSRTVSIRSSSGPMSTACMTKWFPCWTVLRRRISLPLPERSRALRFWISSPASSLPFYPRWWQAVCSRACWLWPRSLA